MHVMWMGLNTDLILERNIIFRCFIVHSKTISLQLAAFSGILALYVDNIIKFLYGHVNCERATDKASCSTDR